MSDVKFTPGPWGIGMRNGHNTNTIYDRLGQDEYSDGGICTVFGLFMHAKMSQQVYEPAIANAHLIAAAPDLYEALLIADKFCGSLTSDVCPDWVHIPIREALAKARGENNG